MSTALARTASDLALRAPGGLSSFPLAGTGTAMQTLAGSVSAFFALENFDRRRGVATYVLRVVNRTNAVLVCRTWVVSRAGDTLLAYPVLFEVEPVSTGVTRVPVWPADFPSFERAIAEVAGDGVHCIVEAPAPPRVPPQRRYAAGGAVLAGFLALAVAAGGWFAAAPRIGAFAVPPEALAGTTVQAEYGVSGSGHLRYAVTAPDGKMLQAGDLGERSGSIPIAIPAVDAPGAYAVRMQLAGPLGTASETRILTAIPQRGRSIAQIQAVSVKPAAAKPGETISVAYAAAGDGGYVRLLGTDGTVWAQRPFSHSGQAKFVVPSVPNLHEMRVIVHVTQGRSSAQTMAGLAVLGDDAPLDAPIAGDDNPSSSASTIGDANGTFQVVGRSVEGGTPIRVRILSPRNGMRITLTDPQSREIASADVGAESDVVTLPAPHVTVPTRYTVVANFTDGFGQESIVQPITIQP
jgi:hypothetical protein